MPGYKYRGTSCVGPVKLPSHQGISTLSSEQQADEIERLLDFVLTKLIGDRQDPVLLFSGGVDSGFIASRLAALGYRESLLLNYSFGEEDAESQVAEAMAKHLGLQFKRVSTERDLTDCLREPGRIYPQPFGDHSTVPTSDFAHAVVNVLKGSRRLIIDGTGADGAFGMAHRIAMWCRIERVPLSVRKAASSIYRRTLWQHRGRIEYLLRILGRSSDMPLLSAVLAQNPLAGTLYREVSRTHVDGLLADWVGGWASQSTSGRIVAADLALTCANTFAQKAQPILDLAEHEVVYPFMDTETVSLAIESVLQWQMVEPKAPLKRSLSRRVPREMVYRTKSGFLDPSRPVFFDADFIAHLRAAAEHTSPISFILNRIALLRACDLLSRRRDLPDQTLNCLWAITFTDRWYRTAL